MVCNILILFLKLSVNFKGKHNPWNYIGNHGLVLELEGNSHISEAEWLD